MTHFTNNSNKYKTPQKPVYMLPVYCGKSEQGSFKSVYPFLLSYISELYFNT